MKKTLSASLALLAGPDFAAAQGMTLAYQGRLTDNGNAYSDPGIKPEGGGDPRGIKTPGRGKRRIETASGSTGKSHS